MSLAAVTFDVNLGSFISLPVLLVVAGLIGLAVKKIREHIDASSVQTLSAVQRLDTKVDGVVVSVAQQGEVLRKHGEDIAYLKGVHAGKAEVAQAASAALGSISLPHEGGITP